jgi:hypothetical protein
MTPVTPLAQLRIADLIDVAPVRTVIRLDEAHERPMEIAESFVITDDVAAHLRIIANLLGQPGGKGVFLQGDFGSGKSHFLAVLTAWLAGLSGSEKLAASHEGFAAIAQCGKRLLPVDVSLVHYRSSTSLERILTGAIEKRLASQGVSATLSPLAIFRQRFKTMLEEPALAQAFNAATGRQAAGIDAWFDLDEREAYAASVTFLTSQGLAPPEILVEERHEIFTRALAAVRQAGYDGLVLIIDELSEFFRSKAEATQLNEEARTLQFLGELASTAPLWIIAAVQESIERTGDIAQATFRKIKDRFPVRLQLSTLHIRELIARRLVKKKAGADEHIYRIYQDYQHHFPAFSCSWEHFRMIYPVHPTTLALLEGLGELFSQHRGIVDFVHSRIAGDSSRGIEGILQRPATELLAPDSIYEHFSPRLLEFSSFHIYPRHVVPHLDEVIQSVLAEEDDRRLARRLMRILVLYALHPTATAPAVDGLAELGACMLADYNPAFNVQFISGSLLEPIADNSRFLSRKLSADGDPLKTVYAITVEEDHSKALKSRIRRVIEELAAEDSRAVLEPLAELPASASWPGPELLCNPVERSVNWRLSSRRAVLGFIAAGNQEQVIERVRIQLTEGKADFALIMVLGDVRIALEHAAVWRVPLHGPDSAALTEYQALRLLRAEMRASNPADAPLLPLLEEHLRRVVPQAQQAVLNLVYAGTFDSTEIGIDPAVLQMKRLDRLLETAAEHLCELRYPRFKEIASRLLPPSPRTYQRLYDEFVVAGSLSLAEARSSGLTQAIESVLAPLGLVEVRAGAYRLTPNPTEHPFLSSVFSLLSSSAATGLAAVLGQLQTGVWGVPRDLAEFLLTSLAQCGLVSLLNHGRSVPLDFLRLSSIENADAVAPGELIGQSYREILQSQCAFLAPAGAFNAFGLRQQRDAWQAAVKLKKSLESLLGELSTRLSSAAGYAAFASFDMEALQATIGTVQRLIGEIKISYAAREGLERFLDAWRELDLRQEDFEFLKKVNRFFQNSAEHFIFVSHYLRHQAVEAAVRDDAAVRRSFEAIGALLTEPLQTVIPDEGVALEEAFGQLRQTYTGYYAARHEKYYAAAARPEVSKYGTRILAIIRPLAAIDCLDRPAGLLALLEEIDRPAKPSCRRNVVEEMLRSPLCSCGYSLDAPSPLPAAGDVDGRLEQSLREYAPILGAPAVVEALTARVYALKDMQPALARQLEKIITQLHQGSATPGTLLDTLDETVIREVARAVSGGVAVESRRLEALVESLAGRRLTPARIREVVETWISRPGEETILAVEGSGREGACAGRTFVGWWPLLQPELFGEPQPGATATELQSLERSLEENYDITLLRSRLQGLDNQRLVRFVNTEAVFTRALRQAWEILAQRVLSRAVNAEQIICRSRHLHPAEAAACVKRLEELQQCAALQTAAFPQRLQARIHYAALCYDNWAGSELQTQASAAIQALSAAGGDWLATLPPVTPLDLTESPLVCILDAVSPDVWIKAGVMLNQLAASAPTRWQRLSTAPRTVPAISRLLGFSAEADPVDRCKVDGIAYHHHGGNESQPWLSLMPEPAADAPVVMRIGGIDRGAHDSSVRLCDMPALLGRMLIDNLPALIGLCRRQRRPLVLTTDHGLSLSRKRLSHGEGGVFEEAVFRMEWRPD